MRACRIQLLLRGSGWGVHKGRYGGGGGRGLWLRTEWLIGMLLEDDNGEWEVTFGLHSFFGLHPFFGALFGLPFVGVSCFLVA